MRTLLRRVRSGVELRTIATLAPFLRLYPATLTAIVTIGILSSFLEGLGLSLFIPLLRTLDPRPSVDSPNWLERALTALFTTVPPEHRLSFIALCIFVTLSFKVALSYGNSVLRGWLDARLGHTLRSRVFAQLLAVGYSFIQSSQSGKLLNTLSTETWRLGGAVSTAITGAIAIATLVVYTALLLLISWKLTVFVLVSLGAMSLGLRVLTRRVRRLGEEAVRANAGLANRMMEGLWAMKIIRAFGREGYEQERFDRASRRVGEVLLRLHILNGAVTPMYQVLAAALLGAILLVNVTTDGNVSSVLVFIFILYRLEPRIRSLDSARVSLIALAPAIEDVSSLLDRKDKPYILSGSARCSRLVTGVRFDNVTFRYPAAEGPSLIDATLMIPAGKTTAIVGPSGAGKSTLINLIFRFYDVSAGEISVDGVPLPSLDLAAWRRRIALVSQDDYAFNATVRENIGYGRPEATFADIVGAATLANAHEFISQLPERYETELGDRGVRVSGGQQQRIVLARAILRDPDILILDEATNELDAISEHVIQEALDALRVHRTIILVAHRLSTISRADHIIVIDGGRVREQGNFKELLARDGLFARLYALQHYAAADDRRV